MEAVDSRLQPFLQERNLFRSAWIKLSSYNQLRESLGQEGLIQAARAPADCPISVIYSTGQYLNTVAEYTGRTATLEALNNPVDTTTNMIMEELKELLRDAEPVVWNADSPPYIHVQSIAHLSGSFEYLDQKKEEIFTAQELLDVREEIKLARNTNTLVWGQDNDELYPVAIRPQYGGYYAFRIVLILPGLIQPDLPRPLAQLA